VQLAELVAVLEVGATVVEWVVVVVGVVGVVVGVVVGAAVVVVTVVVEPPPQAASASAASAASANPLISRSPPMRKFQRRSYGIRCGRVASRWLSRGDRKLQPLLLQQVPMTRV
jgi:hypothetical protein